VKRRLTLLLRQAYKLGLYFLIPALGAVAPLLVIPAITARYGSDGWAAVAIALSLGSTAAVVAELGWGVVGPQRVSRKPDQAIDVYEMSVSTKVLAVIALAPIAAVASAVLAAPYSFSAGAALVAVGAVLGVMSPAWYFIGTGRPIMVLITDTVPKVIVSALSALMISTGAPLEIYGAGLIVATLVGYLCASTFGHLPLWPSQFRLREAAFHIKSQLVIILGRSISTLYTSLPTAFLGIASPNSVGLFSAVDRTMRMGLGLLGGVPARLQSWVGTPNLSLTELRSKQSIAINAGLGLIAAVTYVLVAPVAIDLLFSGEFKVDGLLVVLVGCVAGLICTSRGLGLALVAAERANSITKAIAISAVVGAAGLLLVAPPFGATGTVIALLAAETTGIVVQAVELRREWRRRRA